MDYLAICMIGQAFSEVLKLAGVKDYLGNWANFAEDDNYMLLSTFYTECHTALFQYQAEK